MADNSTCETVGSTEGRNTADEPGDSLTAAGERAGGKRVPSATRASGNIPSTQSNLTRPHLIHENLISVDPSFDCQVLIDVFVCSVMVSADASSPGKSFSRVTFSKRNSLRMSCLWVPGTVNS